MGMEPSFRRGALPPGGAKGGGQHRGV